MAKTISVISIIKSRQKGAKLAYLLGALFGDGCFYSKDGGRIIFSSSDIEFTEKVAEHVKELFSLKINIRKDRLSLKNKNWKDSYIFSSRPLFRYLKCYSNLEIPQFIKNSNKIIKARFIKGFFDAEGNVDIHIIKKRNETQRHLRCSNNNVKILNEIKSFLKEFQINSCISNSKGDNHCLCIWGYKSLLNFESHINFTIQRKRVLLRKAIESYKQIQTRWDIETYKLAMNIRKQKYIGATKIKKEISNFGFDVPKPTIEAWIYRKIRDGGINMVGETEQRRPRSRSADDNVIFVGKKC